MTGGQMQPWSVSSPHSSHRPGNCCVSVTSQAQAVVWSPQAPGRLPSSRLVWVCRAAARPAEKLDRFGLVAASSKENSFNFVVLWDMRLRGKENAFYRLLILQSLYIGCGEEAWLEKENILICQAEVTVQKLVVLPVILGHRNRETSCTL